MSSAPTAAEPLIEPFDLPGSPLPPFRRLSRGRHPFLLLSGVTGRGRSRWTIMGSDPFLTWPAPGEIPSTDPFRAMAELRARFPVRPPAVDLPFAGGLVGYLGYECARFVERVPVRPGDPGDPPDAWFAAYAASLVVDHRERRGYLVASGWPEEDAAARRERAREQLARLRERLSGPEPSPGAAVEAAGAARSTHTPEEYRAAVRSVLDAIRAGEIYQANLTQRFEAPVRGDDPLGLFQRMHQASRAPHAAYLAGDGWTILSASPERFLSLRGDRAESRPIKGTAPRGRDAGTDRRLRRELLASPKNRAENVMIVDLVRNDLHRVCHAGSVRVDALARPETYATLHHLVSTVSGRLRPGCDLADLLRALFPAGSMTGAPKVRAIEILHGLEPVRRGPYAGGLGYASFSGPVDLSVVIRTVVLQDRIARFHVGGGIVSDSDPDAEHEESLLKAQALRTALRT